MIMEALEVVATVAVQAILTSVYVLAVVACVYGVAICRVSKLREAAERRADRKEPRP